MQQSKVNQRSSQSVLTQIRLLEKQYDQGIHCYSIYTRLYFIVDPISILILLLTFDVYIIIDIK